MSELTKIIKLVIIFSLGLFLSMTLRSQVVIQAIPVIELPPNIEAYWQFL